MRVGLAMVVASLLAGPWAAAGGPVDHDLVIAGGRVVVPGWRGDA